MTICNIIPKVRSSRGTIVESKLFSDLWDNYKKSFSAVEARNKAIEAYRTAYSNEFINQFGDWHLVKSFATGNILNKHRAKLTNVYNNDIGYIDNVLRGKTDKNFQPYSHHVLNYIDNKELNTNPELIDNILDRTPELKEGIENTFDLYTDRIDIISRSEERFSLKQELSERMEQIETNEEHFKYGVLFNKLNELLGDNDVNVYFSDLNKGEYGLFSPLSNNIVIAQNQTFHESVGSLLHEGFHAVTARHLIYNKDFNNSIDELRRVALEWISDKPELGFNKSQDYFKNSAEFISYGFTNANFRHLLEQIPYKNESSMWHKFLKLIESTLGIKEGNLFRELVNETLNNIDISYIKADPIHMNSEAQEYAKSTYLSYRQGAEHFIGTSSDISSFKAFVEGNPLLKKGIPKQHVDLTQPERNTTYYVKRHVNRLLSKYAIEYISDNESFNKEQLIKNMLLELKELNEASKTGKHTGLTNAQKANVLDIHSELNKEDSYLWNNFINYFKHVYHIELKQGKPTEIQDISEILAVDETEAINRTESWDNAIQVEINKADRISNKVKFAISELNNVMEDSITGLSEPMEITDVWPTLISAHAIDGGNPASMIQTLKVLGDTMNESYYALAEKLENDSNLLSAYVSALTLANNEAQGLLISPVGEQFEVDNITHNRDSFPSFKLYDRFLKTIDDTYRSDHLNKYDNVDIKQLKLDTSIHNSGDASVRLRNVLNMHVSEFAIENHIENSNNPQMAREKLYGRINNIIEDVISQKRDGVNNYVSDFKGDLLNIAKIAAPTSNIKPNLNYFDVNRNIVYTPQDHSFITRKFANLNTPEAVYEEFIDYTKDPKFQYSNWLWNTTNEGNGIFNYRLEDGVKVVDGVKDVKMEYVEELKLSLYGGNRDIVNHIGSQYQDMLNANWDLNAFISNYFGVHYLSSSDSKRTFQISVPKINIFKGVRVKGKKVPSVEFDNDGNFQSIIRGSEVHERIANTVLQEMSEFIIARDTIFDISAEGNLTLKTEFKRRGSKFHTLRSPKHWDGETVLKNGVPTGRVFQFLNLSILRDGKHIYLNEYMQEKGLNPYTIENVDSFLKMNILDNFIAEALDSNITNTINKFQPIKHNAFSIVRQFNKQNLTPDEISQKRSENRIVKSEADFKKQVASFFINDYLTRVELDNFFIGNQNEYKNSVARNTRSAQVFKNSVSPNYLRKGEDGNFHEVSYKSLQVDDVIVQSQIPKTLKNILRDDVLNTYNNPIESSDGLTIITQEEFVRRMEQFGRFDDYRQLLEDINDRSKPFDPSKYNKLIESLKFFMYTRQHVEAPYSQMVSFQDKSSTVILVDRFIEHTQLSDLREVMREAGADQVTFETSRKVGGDQFIKLDDAGKLVRPKPSQLRKHVTEHSYKDLGIQVETTSHIMDEVNKLGTQVARLITDGLALGTNAYILDGKNMSGQEVFNEYHDVYASQINNSAKELLGEWGALDNFGNIKRDETGAIAFDESAIFQYLKDNMYGDTQNENLLKSVEDYITPGQPNLPIYASVNYRKFVSVLLARIRNKVINQKLPGVHANLVPEIFTGVSNELITDQHVDYDTFIKDGHIKFVDKIYQEIKDGTREGFELKTHRKTEDGKTVIKGEIILNPWMRSMFKEGEVIDINSLTEEQRTMIGVRIPTESMSSMFVVEVVGFLNNGASQAIFPSDYKHKTGWDFDLDSVFLYRKNLKLDKEGNYNIVEYTKDEGNERNRYNNYIYERLNKINAENDIAQDVINKTIETSDRAFDNYLESTRDLSDLRYTNLENVIFNELEAQDIPSITKQFKMLAADMNKQGINSTLQRLLTFKDLIMEEVDFIDHSMQEYSESGLKNVWYENKKTALTHILNVVNDLEARYVEAEGIKQETYTEMKSIQANAWDNLKNNIVDRYVEEHNMIPFNEFKKLSVADQNTSKGKQNRILEVYESILTSEEHQNSIMRANTFDNIKDVGDFINDLYGKNVEGLNTNMYVDEMTLRDINLSVRELKGHSVAFDGLMSILGITNAAFRSDYGIKHAIPVEQLGEQYKGLSEKQIKAKLSNIINGEIEIRNNTVFIKELGLANNKEGTWTDINNLDIKEQTSETTANILDAIKELMGFNINKHTLSVFKLLANQATSYMFNGKPNKFAYAYTFTHQPAIVDLVNRLNQREILSSDPSLHFEIRDIISEYRSELYSTLREGFIKKLGKNHPMIYKFDSAISKGKTIYIDSPASRTGNYRVFHNTINELLAEHNEVLDQSDTSYFTVDKLIENIKYETQLTHSEQEQTGNKAKFLASQINVLNSFNTYYSLGNHLLNLSMALRFDKADMPTLSHTTRMMQSVNNAIFNRQEFIQSLKEAGIDNHRANEITQEFDVLVEPSDKMKFISELEESFKEDGIDFVAPTSKFSVGDKSLIESIFPSIFNSTDRSSYPSMEAYYNNVLDISNKVISKTLLFETDTEGRTGQGWRSLKNRLLSQYGKLGDNRLENTINDYIVNYIVNGMPFLTEYKGTQLLQDSNDPKVAEISRLLNTENTEQVTTPIDQIEFSQFRELSLVNKLRLLNKDNRYNELLLSNAGEAHILHLLEIRDTESDFNMRGYHDVRFIEGEVDNNLTIESIKEMYTHNDPFIRDIAEDLIKQSFILYGFTFGNNMSKVIPAEILFDSEVNKYKDNSLTPAVYAGMLREAHNNVLRGNESATNFVEYMHQSMWNNPHVNPIAKPKIYTDKYGNKKINLRKPVWKKETYEFRGKDFSIIAEPTEAVQNSEYNGREYVTVVDRSGEKTLYKRFDLYEDTTFEEPTTFYYPIPRTLPYEFGRTSIQKYKEGILSETEYKNFISHNHRLGVFKESLHNRMAEIERGVKIIEYGEEVQSVKSSKGTIPFKLSNNIEKILSGQKKLTTRNKKYEAGLYNITDAEGNIQDFNIRLKYKGFGKKVGDRVILTDGNKQIEYTLNKYAELEGFENWTDLVFNSVTLKGFIEGTSNMHVYSVEPGDTAFEFSSEIPNAPNYNKLPAKSSSPTMTYAGVGSRNTPIEIQAIISKVAKELENEGYVLNTGDAQGADRAFSNAVNRKNIFTAEEANDLTRSIAKELHPAWDAMGTTGKNLQARNTNQIFGKNLDTPVDFVIVWTSDNVAHHKDRTIKTGGTGQAISLASLKGIPVINLADANWRSKLDSVLEELVTPKEPTKQETFKSKAPSILRNSLNPKVIRFTKNVELIPDVKWIPKSILEYANVGREASKLHGEGVSNEQFTSELSNRIKYSNEEHIAEMEQLIKEGLDVSSFYAAAYAAAAREVIGVDRHLKEFTHDTIEQYDGISEEHHTAIVNGIRKARIRRSKQYADLESDIVETGNSLSEITNILSSESDVTVYIGDRSENITDKLIKSNIQNPVNINIANNIESEVNKLISSLPKNKALDIFITGDLYDSIRYNHIQVNEYVAKFLNILNQRFDNINKIKTVVNDGIGNAVYNNNIYNTKTYKPIGVNADAVLSNHDTPVRFHSDITEHNTQAENQNNKTLELITKLDAQKELLHTSIKNLYRLSKGQTANAHKDAKMLEAMTEYVAERDLYSKVGEHEIAAFADVLSVNSEQVAYTVEELNEVISQLNNTDIESMFTDDATYEDKVPFVKNVKFALDLSNSISFIKDLRLLKNTEAEKHASKEIIDHHDELVKNLRELDAEIDGYRDILKTIHDRYIHRVASQWTRNPRFRSVFAQAREGLLVDGKPHWTDQEIANELAQLFTDNEDLGFVMMWADSGFDTGVTLVDSVLKEYFHARDGRDKMVDSFETRVMDLISKHTGIARDRVGKSVSARERIDWFDKFVDKNNGDLIGEYNWNQYYDNMTEVKSKTNDLYTEADELETMAEEGVDVNGNNLSDRQIKEYYDKSGQLRQEAKEMMDKWYEENTNQNEELYFFTQEEMEILNKAKEELTEKQYRSYLRSKHLYLKDYDANDVSKIIPSDKYKSERYKRLKDTEREFLTEYKNMVHELLENLYGTAIKSDTFFPVSIKETNKQMIKKLIGYKSISKLDFYVGLNEDVVYMQEVPMIQPIQKNPIIKLRRNRPDENLTEYNQNVVNEINERFKLVDDKKFTSIEQIKKQNIKNAKENRKFTAEMQSYDPHTVMKEFINQIGNYKLKRDFEHTFKLLQYNVGSNRFRVKSKKRGLNMTDTLKSFFSGKRELVEISGQDTRIYQRLKPLNDTLWEQSNVNNKLDQGLNILKQYTSLTYMAFNVYGGIKNVSKGLHDMVMEGVAGEFIESEHLKWGISHYPAMNLLRSIHDTEVNDLNTAVIRRHWRMLDLKNEKGVEYTPAERERHLFYMMHDSAYFANRITEHFMQYSMLLAATQSHRVVNGIPMTFQEYLGDVRYNILKDMLSKEQLLKLDKAIKFQKEQDISGDLNQAIASWVRQTLPIEQQKELSQRLEKNKKQAKEQFENNFETVYDQYSLKEGKAVIKEGSTLSEARLAEFERRVHIINHQLHGVYNRLDQNMIKQSAIGEVLLQFRSWMRPNFNRYFGSRLFRTKFNEGLGTWQKGAYVSAWDFITIPIRDAMKPHNRTGKVSPVEAVTNMIRDYGKFLRNISIHFKNLAPYEQANIMRAVANLVQILGLSSLLYLLGSISDTEDGEKEMYALAFAIYELNMIHSEITQFTVPYGMAGMISRTKQYVAPSEKVFLDTYKMMQHLFAYPFRDEDAREYQAGVFRGRDKLSVAFQRNTPFIRQHYKAVNVPVFTDWYKLHNPFSSLFSD